MKLNELLSIAYSVDPLPRAVARQQTRLPWLISTRSYSWAA